ncbi:MAG: hypothetical protein LBG61_05745, partial [Burkholderiales bacterium]|nr:hypothetical protein [Burkholderiales bacterium]
PVKPFTDLPQFALDIQRLFVDNRELGHLEIAARPEGDEWIIDDLELNNTDGKVAVRGRWRAPAGAGQTQLLLETNIKNVNRFLTRFDIPEGLVASDAIVSGYLQWDDAPHRLDIQTLSGHLDIAVGRGRFTKIDPGIGRLLAVFSLQALPRRITLDFRDVFSEGFSFDSISGKTGIEHGILTANNLLLNGPSAKVKINGQVDLVHETQQLDVFVRANMSETLSVGAAGASMLVIGSTPIGAAAIGLGALVGQLMFDDPIGKMLSFEYRVEGSWNEPVVAKKTTPARDADEAPAGP